MRLRLLFDRLATSAAMRDRAAKRARQTVAHHGNLAGAVIHAQLADTRRRRSLRELRLALDHVRRMEAVHGPDQLFLAI